jgi:hypothetical protein
VYEQEMTDAKKERTPLDLYHHQWAIDERARVAT